MNETEIEPSGGVGTKKIELSCQNDNSTLAEEFELLYGANYQFVYVEHDTENMVKCLAKKKLDFSAFSLIKWPL